jgi:hypothetical protein
MSYDVWDNLLTLTGRHLLSDNSFASTYANDRNNGWQHDEAGNLKDTAPIVGGGQEYTYNAAGRMSETMGPSGTFTVEYDRDGREVKRTEGATSTYYVRSAVLDGRTISEVNGSGLKIRTFVYAGSQRLARQGESGGLKFEHTDPASTSVRRTNSSGSETLRLELDPLGVETSSSSTGPPPPFPNPGGLYGFPGNPSTGCYLDKQPMPCSVVAAALNAGWVQSVVLPGHSLYTSCPDHPPPSIYSLSDGMFFIKHSTNSLKGSKLFHR